MPNTEELVKLEGKIDDLHGEIRDKLEVELKEMRLDIESMDEKIDIHADKILKLELWRDSNGSPGAEDRLRCAERFITSIDKENLPPRMSMVEAEVEALQKIAYSAIMESVQGAVNVTLDKRAKTAVEKVKAWGPIVSAAIAATAVVLAAVL